MKTATDDWPAFREVVTVADVLAEGACIEGTLRFVKEHGGMISGAAAEFPDNEFIVQAARCNGDGYGYGYGYGYGDGYGDGGLEE